MIRKIFTSNLLIFLSISLITVLFYIFTVSNHLTWANFGNDGGDFLAAILTAGIPHPTGYPTYTLLGIIFQQLPLGDEYFRAAMLSWFPAALGAGFLALWVRRFLQEQTYPNQIAIPVALTAGLIWGLMPFLWSQAVIIEVHGLQSLFLVLALWWTWLLMCFNPDKKEQRKLLLSAFFFGLSLGNHITILFFIPVLILAFFLAKKNGLTINLLIGQIIAVLIGSLIYLYLPLRATHFPPINWGNPQNWHGFLWVISGGPYQNLLLATSLSQVITRISALANLLIQQFGIIGVILGVIGAVQYKHNRKAFPFMIIYLFVAYSLFAILYATDDSITYLLTPFLIFTLWIVFAISIIIPVIWRKFPLGYVLFALFLIFFAFKTSYTIKEINPRQQTQPTDYAEYLLTHLPENAILLTSSDRDSFPLWYYHFGLESRPDLRIIVLPLTQFRWYQQTITTNYPDLEFPPIISQFTNQSQIWGESIPAYNSDRPFCNSTILQSQGISINVRCSTGQNFLFDYSISNQ